MKNRRQKAEGRRRKIAHARLSTTCHSLPAERRRGFTLVEMIVAVALFAVVMLVAVGALLALTAADRKAQALQSVMNNLNVSLDDMVRNLRMGSQYHCGTGGFVGDGSDDCSLGGTAATFACNPNTAGCASARWGYAYDLNGSICGQAGSICETKDGGSTWAPITAPEVAIESMTFYVVGTKPGDAVQPKVLIVVKGQAGGAAGANAAFHIEATAVQRELDLAQ